jgi:ADP-ribosyl-[dinitrogen reductase] hydrolase
MKQNIVHAALYGVAIGDALGVPAEFNTRDYLEHMPVQDFEGFKAHNQPPGTFSDDSSCTFCIAESLCNGYDLNDIGARFVKWFYEGYWTAGGDVFGVGKTTQNSIERLKNGIPPTESGNFDESCNGNGSLMRTIPLLFYIRHFEIEKRYEIIKEVSSITHGYIRCVIACFYYLEFALDLLNGSDKQTAYEQTAKRVYDFITAKKIPQHEIELFTRLLKQDITKESLDNLPSRHYVAETLHAAMYCFMTTNNYQQAVLKAVNLGHDTDTTAAVTGGLAGLYYGFESIPEKWIREIRRSDDIKNLCDRLSKAMEL